MIHKQRNQRIDPSSLYLTSERVDPHVEIRVNGNMVNERK